MKTVLHYKGYSAKPEYSAEDQVFYGKILGIDDLIDFYTDSAKEIEKEFHAAVDDYLEYCAEIGKQPQKEYSGTFNVRIAPELHRQAARKAQEESVPLNKVVEQALNKYLNPSWEEGKVMTINSEATRMFLMENRIVDTAENTEKYVYGKTQWKPMTRGVEGAAVC